MDIVVEYVMAKAARLQQQKAVDILEQKEKELKAQIIALMRAGTSLGPSTSKVTLVTKTKPVADSWEAIYGFIKSTGAFDLLQRRLTETAVQARWEDNIEIPGINKFPVYDISISKD
jgi:hypothetical protein